jgi:cytochrome P450
MSTSLSDQSLEQSFLDPDVIRDPYPFLAALRERDPVHWSEVHHAWVLTRYADVVAAFNDARFSSNRVKPMLEKLSDERREKAGRIMEMIQDWMVVTDPPVHTRLRGLVAMAFNPKRIAAAEQRIRELVDELLDEFISSGNTDFIGGFSFPLPATVIAELIGAPAEDRDNFRRWSEDLTAIAFGAAGEGRASRHETSQRGLEEMLAYFGERIDYAETHPGPDMISGLLEGDGKGNRLERDEMETMCALMLFAGHETTMNLLNAMVLHVTGNPDQLKIVLDDPGEVPGAVEEVLRFDGPIKILHRVAVADVELHGKTIRAGDRVFLSPSGANHDSARFPDPDRLDITRAPNPHVAFGRGVHTCIGAQLSRLEGRVAFARVLERLPGLHVPEQPLEFAPVLAARALTSLQVGHDAK